MTDLKIFPGALPPTPYQISLTNDTTLLNLTFSKLLHTTKRKDDKNIISVSLFGYHLPTALRSLKIEIIQITCTKECRCSHCTPLQDLYRVELLHREIPVVITGNGFAVYTFFLFWLHSFPVLLTLLIRFKVLL